jgi:hypothetical protein
MSKWSLWGGVVAAALWPAAAMAQTMPGFEIGPELYYYSYREPNFVAQTGPYIGANASYTWVTGGWFFTGNLIADLGYLNYSSNGTGKTTGIWNFTGDLRALAGHDFAVLPSTVASPFTGIGYRILFDQAGGRSTSTGAVGYDRLSRYLYLPIGLALGITTGDWVLRPSVEYDFLIQGAQTSYLTEAGFDNDPTNKQRNGYGLRAAFLAETATSWGRLSFGPFIRYWNIRSSDTAALNFAGAPRFTVFEPANNTIEAGATARLHF